MSDNEAFVNQHDPLMLMRVQSPFWKCMPSVYNNQYPAPRGSVISMPKSDVKKLDDHYARRRDEIGERFITLPDGRKMAY